MFELDRTLQMRSQLLKSRDGQGDAPADIAERPWFATIGYANSACEY
jgi:hypothetical protein